MEYLERHLNNFDLSNLELESNLVSSLVTHFEDHSKNLNLLVIGTFIELIDIIIIIALILIAIIIIIQNTRCSVADYKYRHV